MLLLKIVKLDEKNGEIEIFSSFLSFYYPQNCLDIERKDL